MIATRISYALGYLAGVIDNRTPGPWAIRRRLRDGLMSWTRDGGAARDGFDHGVGHD
jgi:hypothetical protein